MRRLFFSSRTLGSSVAVYGDSTAAGDLGGPPKWYTDLAGLFTPALTVSSNGVGGQNSTQMLAGIAADTAHATWWHICMDLPNTGESATTWLDNMAGAIALQPRTLVFPPAQDSPGSFRQNVADVQAALLSDSRFAGRIFDATLQAAYLTAVSDPATRSDGTHFSTAGQAVQAQYIATFLVANNWLPGNTPA